MIVLHSRPEFGGGSSSAESVEIAVENTLEEAEVLDVETTSDNNNIVVQRRIVSERDTSGLTEEDVKVDASSEKYATVIKLQGRVDGARSIRVLSATTTINTYSEVHISDSDSFNKEQLIAELHMATQTLSIDRSTGDITYYSERSGGVELYNAGHSTENVVVTEHVHTNDSISAPEFEIVIDRTAMKSSKARGKLFEFKSLNVTLSIELDTGEYIEQEVPLFDDEVYMSGVPRIDDGTPSYPVVSSGEYKFLGGWIDSTSFRYTTHAFYDTESVKEFIFNIGLFSWLSPLEYSKVPDDFAFLFRAAEESIDSFRMSSIINDRKTFIEDVDFDFSFKGVNSGEITFSIEEPGFLKFDTNGATPKKNMFSASTSGFPHNIVVLIPGGIVDGNMIGFGVRADVESNSRMLPISMSYSTSIGETSVHAFSSYMRAMNSAMFIHANMTIIMYIVFFYSTIGLACTLTPITMLGICSVINSKLRMKLESAIYNNVWQSYLDLMNHTTAVIAYSSEGVSKDIRRRMFEQGTVSLKQMQKYQSPIYGNRITIFVGYLCFVIDYSAYTSSHIPIESGGLGVSMSGEEPLECSENTFMSDEQRGLIEKLVLLNSQRPFMMPNWILTYPFSVPYHSGPYVVVKKDGKHGEMYSSDNEYFRMRDYNFDENDGYDENIEAHRYYKNLMKSDRMRHFKTRIQMGFGTGLKGSDAEDMLENKEPAIIYYTVGKVVLIDEDESKAKGYWHKEMTDASIIRPNDYTVLALEKTEES